MQLIESRLRPGREDYENNREAMLGVLQPVLEAQQSASRGGGEKACQRMRERGKWLPRQRVRHLLDPGAPFLELSPLAAQAMFQGESPGGSLITGIGRVSGRLVMVIANDATIKGGAINPITLKKHLRAQQIASENQLLTITLVESAGANLLYQAELFAETGGRVFANQARMSARGIPQISLVFGSSTAGGAYIPGMSDYVVMVQNQARVFLGGPPLVKMATGEIVDEETLGGARMHAQVSGVSDYLARDDAHALEIGRDIVAALGRRSESARSGREPLYDAEELLGVIPADPRQPLEIREVLARLLDASEWLEFKPDYGSTLVAGHASIGGYPVGILANNGVLFSEAALKGAQFIQLCNQSRIPILFVQNITGFMVGSAYEREGIVKHGSKLVNAVSTSNVPHLTLIVGGSYGAGNYGMCGRAFEPRFLFTWPNSTIAVMGGEQAAGVMGMLAEEQARSRGVEVPVEAIVAQQERIRQQFENESSALYATARVWDDGILDPRHTRRALAMALEVVYQSGFERESAPHYGVFRM